MPDTPLEVVRRCLDAWKRGDFDTALAQYSEDAVWQGTGIETHVYRGREGVARAMEEWVGAFSDYWLEFDECIEAGDHVAVVWREGGKGRTSGVDVEETGATLFSVTNGKIVSALGYAGREEALAAATSAEGPGPRP